MPFVVERISVSAAGSPAISRGELPKSKPGIDSSRRSPASFAGPFGLRERARLLDLRAAEHAAIPGRERLRHRRGRTQHVDDDADRRRRLLPRSEGDVHEHAARLVAMSTAATGLPTCYRHPDRETGLSCSECGRPICTECMTPAPVGLRCPDHAGTRRRVSAAARRPPHERRACVRRPRHEGARSRSTSVDLPDHGRAGHTASTAPGGALFDKCCSSGRASRTATGGDSSRRCSCTLAPPHRLQHARALGDRRAGRAVPRPRALHRPLLRLRPRRLRGRARL